MCTRPSEPRPREDPRPMFPKPRRDRDETFKIRDDPRRNLLGRDRDILLWDRDETKTRRYYVSRPSRDRDVSTETTSLAKRYFGPGRLSVSTPLGCDKPCITILHKHCRRCLCGRIALTSSRTSVLHTLYSQTKKTDNKNTKMWLTANGSFSGQWWAYCITNYGIRFYCLGLYGSTVKKFNHSFNLKLNTQINSKEYWFFLKVGCYLCLTKEVTGKHSSWTQFSLRLTKMIKSKPVLVLFISLK